MGKVLNAIVYGSLAGVFFSAVISGIIGIIFWGFPEWYGPRYVLTFLVFFWIGVGLNVEFKGN